MGAEERGALGTPSVGGRGPVLGEPSLGATRSSLVCTSLTFESPARATQDVTQETLVPAKPWAYQGPPGQVSSWGKALPDLGPAVALWVLF